MSSPAPAEGVKFDFLKGVINDATTAVQKKLTAIKEGGENVQIGDMFEMQMLMNHLSQLSEMSTSVMASMNTSIASMARNVKG